MALKSAGKSNIITQLKPTVNINMNRLIKYLALFAIIIVLLFYRCDHDRTNTDSLTSLKNYTDTFYPVNDTLSNREVQNEGFPFPPDSLKKLIESHKLTPEYKEILVLIFLKFCFAQKYQYGVLYEIRLKFPQNIYQRNLFVDALCEISPDKCQGEFVTSAVAFELVSESKEYLNNKEIYDIYNRILELSKQ